MPRIAGDAIPTYRRHKQSGQAVVTLNGRDVLLGKHATKGSREKYNRVIAEWLAAGRQLIAPPEAVLVLQIVNAHRKHAESYYRLADGTPTSEIDNFKAATAPLLRLYGRTPAAEFGPLKLKALRDEMIRLGWCRKSVNKHCGRVKLIFSWATENELIPPMVAHALREVKGLRAGRSDAVESDPVKPVPVEYVEAALPFVSAPVVAMIRLQMLTAMRPGEVCAMRGADIDTTGKLWLFKPSHHKTKHHGHAREIYLGPRAQEVVRPFLRLNPGEYLFDPRDAERDRRTAANAKRRTPAGYGNTVGTNRRAKPKRTIGDRYNSDSYRRAITRACDRANLWHKGGLVVDNDERVIPRWHPHQLRHNCATDMRKQFGLEAAQVILGDRELSVAQLYAEKNAAAAMKIVAEVG